MKTVAATLAALALSASAAMAECNWGSYTAMTKVDVKAKQMELAAAQVPVDAWLIKYLDQWQKA